MSQEQPLCKSSREPIAAILIFAIGVPAIIVLHELGHYLAAIAFGYNAHLSYAAVYYASTGGPIPDSHNLWITAAGPLVNFVFPIAGVIALSRFSRSKERSKTRWWLIWIISVFVSSGGRGLMKVFSPKGTDEAEISQLLGMPDIAGPLIMAVPSVAFAFFLFLFHWRGRSVGTLMLGWAGGFAGMMLWLKVLGRIVMP